MQLSASEKALTHLGGSGEGLVGAGEGLGLGEGLSLGDGLQQGTRNVCYLEQK